jgi:hypothetical protein
MCYFPVCHTNQKIIYFSDHKIMKSISRRIIANDICGIIACKISTKDYAQLIRVEQYFNKHVRREITKGPQRLPQVDFCYNSMLDILTLLIMLLLLAKQYLG